MPRHGYSNTTRRSLQVSDKRAAGGTGVTSPLAKRAGSMSHRRAGASFYISRSAGLNAGRADVGRAIVCILYDVVASAFSNRKATTTSHSSLVLTRASRNLEFLNSSNLVTPSRQDPHEVVLRGSYHRSTSAALIRNIWTSRIEWYSRPRAVSSAVEEPGDLNLSATATYIHYWKLPSTFNREF